MMIKIEVKPKIDSYELARLFGGSRSSRFSRSTKIKIVDMEGILIDRMEPSIYFLIRQIDSINKGSVHLQEGPVFKSTKLSKTMKECEEVICFIATLGNGVDNEIKGLMDGNRFSEAYVLDAMGSVAVENMVERFHKRESEKYQVENKGITLPFSPGYCDWPLKDQKKVFNLFDSFQLNVKLSESCLMEPRKSISGVFGVTPLHLSIPFHRYNPCMECSKKNCIARRRN
jgi:hypothetical protein